jgi:hypothetical protein
MFEGQEHKKGRTAVFGIFQNRPALETAISTLKDRGFRNSDISVLMPTEEETQTLAYEKGTKAPEGATTGSASGLVLGGAFGWLVGAGALAIPGIGPFVAAGPILSALAGAGIGGTIGGITGALVGMGIPKYEAKRYETHVKEGAMLISVHVDDGDWEDKATDLLESCGAKDIASTTEKRVEDDFVDGINRPDENAYQSFTPPL